MKDPPLGRMTGRTCHQTVHTYGKTQDSYLYSDSPQENDQIPAIFFGYKFAPVSLSKDLPRPIHVFELPLTLQRHCWGPANNVLPLSCGVL